MQNQVSGSSKNLWWQVAALSAPLILQNLSQTLLGVVDTFFVSRLGTDAVAAVGLASVMFFAVLMLFRSTAYSTVVFVGRAHGEGDDAKIGLAVWRSINMLGWLSLIVLVLPFLFGALMAVSAPPDNPNVQTLSTRYLQIRSFEMPLVMFTTLVFAFLIGRGDSRTPMILAWITVALNIVLDWMFVLGNLGAPQLGVTGAAVATLTANLFSAILSGAILWNAPNRKKFGTHLARRVGWAELRKGFEVGLPMGMGDFVEIASFSVFFALIARLGTEVLAANQIALQYMTVSFTFGGATAMATSSLVAQYLGAKQPDVAEKVAYRAIGFAGIGMGLIGLSYLIAPATLIGVFSQEPKVIEAGVTVLRLVALYQIFDAFGIVLGGALNGAGDTQFTMWARLLMAWGLFLPVAWALIFPLDSGSWGAWLAALIYMASIAVVYLIRFRAGKWKLIELA